MTYPNDTATPSMSVESEGRGLTISALQAAHVARQDEWCPDQKPDLSFRGNEMAGEVGEACNVIKKLERERQGWRGSRATVDDLGDELADVVHTSILCAITAGIDLEPRVVAKFNATSEKNGLSTRLSPTPSPAAKSGEVARGDTPYCDGAVAHIDIGGLLDRHVEELRVHASKLRWQMENDERPVPSHGWTCFHCAQTFTTTASASAHFGSDPLSGRPECCDRAALADPAPTGEAVEPIEKHRIANRLRGMFDMAVASADDFNRLSPAGFRLLRQAHDALVAPEDTARLSGAVGPGAADRLAFDRLCLWFFRDLYKAQRLSLFGLFGWPVEEITDHGREKMVFRKIISPTVSKDTVHLREDLERVTRELANWKLAHEAMRSTAVQNAQNRNAAERERDDARKALAALEAACERLAALRSQGTYLHMLDDEGAEDALLSLDEARAASRAVMLAARDKAAAE